MFRESPPLIASCTAGREGWASCPTSDSPGGIQSLSHPPFSPSLLLVFLLQKLLHFLRVLRIRQQGRPRVERPQPDPPAGLGRGSEREETARVMVPVQMLSHPVTEGPEVPFFPHTKQPDFLRQESRVGTLGLQIRFCRKQISLIKGWDRPRSRSPGGTWPPSLPPPGFLWQACFLKCKSASTPSLTGLGAETTSTNMPPRACKAHTNSGLGVGCERNQRLPLQPHIAKGTAAETPSP